MGLTNDEAERLQEILDLLAGKLGDLRDRERQFVSDQIARYEEYGAEMRLSPAQWKWLQDLYNRNSP